MNQDEIEMHSSMYDMPEIDWPRLTRSSSQLGMPNTRRPERASRDHSQARPSPPKEAYLRLNLHDMQLIHLQITSFVCEQTSQASEIYYSSTVGTAEAVSPPFIEAFVT
jgi:hypothetical protein